MPIQFATMWEGVYLLLVTYLKTTEGSQLSEFRLS